MPIGGLLTERPGFGGPGPRGGGPGGRGGGPGPRDEGGLITAALDAPPQIDPDDPQRSIGRWFGEMVMNIPGSSWQFAKDITGLLRPSTWKALGQLTHDEEMQGQVWDYMKERYGGLDEIRDSMREDPVGIFGDVVGAISGGSLLAGKLAATGGKVARVARVASNVADMVDPLNVAVRTGRRAVTDIAPGVSASLAAVSPATVRQWIRTGFEGGEAQQNFNRIIANLSIEDMGSMATRLRNGLNQVRARRATEYQEAMARMDKAVETVDIGPLRTKLDELEAARTATDAAGGNVWLPNDPRQKVFEQIREMVEAADGLPPTIENIDKLKQAINTLYTPTDPGVSQIVTEAYNLVKDQIAAQAPEYTQIMADYTRASDNIFNLEREFRLGNKATDPQIFSRALSTTRDQVNTHFGGRHQLLSQLDEGVFSDLAAAAGHPTGPTGMRRSGSALVGLQEAGRGLATGDPSALMTAAIPYVGTTPRVHAQLANTAGQVAGAPRQLLNRAPQSVQDIFARAQNFSQTPVAPLRNPGPSGFTMPQRTGVPGAWPLASSAGRNPFQPSTWVQPRGPSTVGQIPYRATAATARATRPLMDPLLADRTPSNPAPSAISGPSFESLTPQERQEFLDQLYRDR